MVINLMQEIKAVGLPCEGVDNGVPVTGELSAPDQAIVDAVVACHEQPFTSAEKTALWALLTAQQQDDYTAERNRQVLVTRLADYTDEASNETRILYLCDDLAKKDFTDDIDAVKAAHPLWSDT